MNEADAARWFGFDGDVVPGVGFAGTTVTAVVRPDDTEVRRREQVGPGAVLDFDVTDRLADLPVDCPVPRDQLDRATIRLLQTAPPGVVEDTDTAVIRRWRPALTVTGILLVTGRQWRTGLANVSLFAPGAPPRHWRLLEIAYLAWREHVYTDRPSSCSGSAVPAGRSDCEP